jgi:hypothetical protein
VTRLHLVAAAYGIVASGEKRKKIEGVIDKVI